MASSSAERPGRRSSPAASSCPVTGQEVSILSTEEERIGVAGHKPLGPSAVPRNLSFTRWFSPRLDATVLHEGVEGWLLPLGQVVSDEDLLWKPTPRGLEEELEQCLYGIDVGVEDCN